MSTSDLTIEMIQTVYGPMVFLSGAPEMNDMLWASLLALFASEGIDGHELGQAVIDVLKREKFWPAPAVLIERITENRKTALLASREAQRKSQLKQLEAGGSRSGDTHYGRERQAMKKKLGLGEYRSGAHQSRYGPEIEVTESYVPPSLRKLMADEPDPDERTPGVRRMF